MSYVIYEVESTRFLRILRNGYWQDASYKTEGAAKAALKRHLSKQAQNEGKVGATMPVEFAISERGVFHATIEKTRKVRNLLNPQGGEIEIPMNTPRECDPSSELYHSM